MGRIVIPIEIRRKFDIDLPNATVEFFADNDGILIKKYSQKCIFCDSQEELVEFGKKIVCKRCIKLLNNCVK